MSYELLAKYAAGLLGLGSVYVLAWTKRVEPAVYIQLVTAALVTLGILTSAGGAQ